MLKQSIQFNSMVLGIFAMVTALLLASTYLGTRDRIAQSEREAAQKALLEIFPQSLHDNDILEDTLDIPDHYWPTLGLKGEQQLHVVRLAGKVVGFIIPAVAPDGYTGEIKLIIGVTVDGTIAGVRTLAHNETPGLGDKVDIKKSDWILSFNGKSLRLPEPDRWKVKKDKGDFDQFTGATITPRAVVSRVYNTLVYFKEDRQRLFKVLKQPLLPIPEPAGSEATAHE